MAGAGIEGLPIRAYVGDARPVAEHGANGTCASEGVGVTKAQAAFFGLGTFFADTFTLRQGCSNSAEPKYPPHHSRPNGLERLAARGRRRNRFCKLVKLRRIHLRSLLCVNAYTHYRKKIAEEQ